MNFPHKIEQIQDGDVHKYLHFLRCPPKLLGMMCPGSKFTLLQFTTS